MAATERVVVLLTPEQRKLVAERARAEKLSLSDDMRRQALGDDELLAGPLSELRLSTVGGLAALDRTISRLQQVDAARAEVEAEASERARAEFEEIDVDALTRLRAPSEEHLRNGRAAFAGGALSTVSEILEAVRGEVVMNERIIALSKQVDRLEAQQSELRERVIRIDTFIDMVRPAITRRALPPSSDE